MSDALYRKYRPHRFVDVRGQEGVVGALKNQIARNCFAHAYIFSGTRGTGKTTMARLVASALNCPLREAGAFEPCGQCVSCVDTAAGRSVDVIELDAATHTGVDTVREHIVENAQFLPTRDKLKIFIIDEAHMLSTSSFNALLKSIEEPPPHVIFILATTELHKIPATIISRCQRFVFRPLAPNAMRSRLEQIAEAEGVHIEQSVLQRLLSVSGGAMRDAESLLGQLVAFGQKNITDDSADAILPQSLISDRIALWSAWLGADQQSCFAIVKQLHENGADLALFHDGMIAIGHCLLVASVTNELPIYLGIFSESDQKLIQSTAANQLSRDIADRIQALLHAQPLYKSLGQQTLPLYLALTACQRQKKEEIEATPTKSYIPQSVSPAQSPQHEHVFSREQIVETWNAVAERMIEQSPSLSIVLGQTSIGEVSGNKIFLNVPYPLYAVKLNEQKTKTALETAFQSALGALPCCIISTGVSENQTSAPTELTDALASFDGLVAPR